MGERWHRLVSRPHLGLIALVGVIVPRRLRADWRLEWETELRHREMLLAEWDRLHWRGRMDLLRRSTSAFWDALWLQRKRLEAEVLQDVRYGARLLLAQPAFTLIAVLTLALGIGANTATFTLLDHALLRPLPVAEPDHLVTVAHGETAEPMVVSYPLYTALRDGNDVLAGLAAYFQRPFSITEGVASERVVGQLISANYFTVAGVRPALGRFFSSEEESSGRMPAIAVISHRLWQRRFAGDPAAVGRDLPVNGHRYTIVGVTPEAFRGTTRGTITDVYVPIVLLGQVLEGSGGMLQNANAGWLQMIGRLRPHVTRPHAQAALAALERGVRPEPGRKDSGSGARTLRLLDGSRGVDERVRDLEAPLVLMMGIVGFVLAIACANVANLLLARTSRRSREIAVRLAVGAGRSRIVRQLVTEGALLAALSALPAIAIAYAVVRLFLGVQQTSSIVPRTLDIALDARALAFTAGLSMLTAIVFSLVPALHISKPDLVQSIKRAGAAGTPRRRPVMRAALLVTQVALSLVVLVGAGLCVRSLRTLDAIDPGLEPDRVLTASFDLKLNGYTKERGLDFVGRLSDRVTRLPGVESVSFANIVAFSDGFWIAGMSIEGYQPQPNERMPFDINVIGSDYFRTIGTPLTAGREFTANDHGQSPRVLIVNEAAARRYWPGQDPVGRSTSRGQVVGVVRDTKEKGLTKTARPAVYMPLQQSYVPELTLHVRAAHDPRGLLAPVRRELELLDATLPVYDVATLAQQKNGALHTQRLAAMLTGIFGALALLVVTVGIYGVLSYSVTERTREIGIRLAHGAQRADLMRLVIGQGMTLTAIGVVVGIGAALATASLMRHLLFGVSTTDPFTFVAIPLVLIVVALFACWIPARRATRMDPLAALRYE